LGRRLNIEDDPGAFRVLLSLVDEDRNPKEIAKLLNLKPPTVIYHLNKLRKIGFVKRLEKLGKDQPYGIEWKNIYEFALKEWIPRISLAEEFPKLKTDETERFKQLTNDTNFQNFIHEGFKTLNQLLLKDKRLVTFGLRKFIIAMPDALRIFTIGDFNLENATPLFVEFIQKILETKWLNNIAYRWINAFEAMKLLKHPYPLKMPLKESL